MSTPKDDKSSVQVKHGHKKSGRKKAPTVIQYIQKILNSAAAANTSVALCEPQNKVSPPQSTSNPIYCETCGYKASHLNELKNHMSTEHGGSGTLCLICNVYFESVDSLILHQVKYKKSEILLAESHWLEKTNQRRRYYCNLCGRGFPLIYLMILHKKDVHGLDIYQGGIKNAAVYNNDTFSVLSKLQFCEQCGKRFFYPFAKYRHFHMYDLKCVLCQKSFKDFQLLAAHCGSFHRRCKLIQHEEADKVINGLCKYFCKYCGKGFYFMDELLWHRATDHSNSMQQIDEEEEIDNWVEAANQLTEVLSREAILENMYDNMEEIVSLSDSDESSLDQDLTVGSSSYHQHSRANELQVIWTCPTCKQSFGHWRQFDMHQAEGCSSTTIKERTIESDGNVVEMTSQPSNVDGIKPFLCSMCPKRSFATEKDLQKHLLFSEHSFKRKRKMKRNRHDDSKRKRIN